jgi:hypothetical protein
MGDSVDGGDDIAAMVKDDLWLAWLDDLLAAVRRNAYGMLMPAIVELHLQVLLTAA